MDLNVKDLSDQDIINLINKLKEEQRERSILKMDDDELFQIAKAKNGEYSDEEALFALNIMFKRNKPSLGRISTLKQMSHSEDVREACKEFLFPSN
jgi:hypothetical protein